MTDRETRNCPRCDSPSPRLHPAIQFEGEVAVCTHSWHGPLMADRMKPEDKHPICEVCEEFVEGGALQNRIGCCFCGRMFGPCCNSQEDGACVECVG